MGFTNNKTDKILEFKNQGIKAAAGTVNCTVHCNHCNGPQEIGGILETCFYASSEIYSYYKIVCIKIHKKKF